LIRRHLRFEFCGDPVEPLLAVFLDLEQPGFAHHSQMFRRIVRRNLQPLGYFIYAQLLFQEQPQDAQPGLFSKGLQGGDTDEAGHKTSSLALVYTYMRALLPSLEARVILERRSRLLRWKIAVMLLPAVLILGGLFAGGLGLALAQSLGDFPPAGEHRFTLSHYRSLLFDPEVRISIALTFLLATIATAISAAAGLALALTFRNLARGSRALSAMLQMPIAVPHLAMAVLLISLIGQSGWLARLAHFAGLITVPADFPALINDRYGLGIAIAYVLKETPFIALVMLTMLRRIDGEYEVVAATLGASAWQRFRYVTLPLAAPSVVSASLLVFAFIFGAYEVPFLLGRPYPAMLGVLAQRRFLSADLTDRPDAIAVAVLMTIVSTLLVFAYLHLGRKVVGERPTLF